MSKENINVSEVSQNLAATTSEKEVRDIKSELFSTPFLLTKSIGFSSSESDDLDVLGLSELHLRDLVIEINRYLLAGGASIVYGGDLRVGGLTEVLISLVGSYSFPDQDQSSRLKSYLAFPLSLNLSRETEAQYIDRISFLKVEPPEDLDLPSKESFIPPVGSHNLYIWAKSLTKMRHEMEDVCDARVFIGGRALNYKGRAPGVLEEILISCNRRTPMYLVGGFGGVVANVVSHLEGKDKLKDILSQIKETVEYRELRRQYEKNHFEEQMDWPDELLLALDTGWNIISDRNGLSVEENRILAGSTHVIEIIYYILKGLAVLCKK